MKIVFITARSLSSIGGIETYMKNLCPRLVAMGHEVILYSEEDKWGKYDYKGTTIITIPSIKSKFFNKIIASCIATFHLIFFVRNVDIVHYNAVAAGIFSFIPRILRYNVVFQGHGFEWQRAKWSCFTRKIIKLADDIVIKINNNITMVSEEQSEYVRKKNKNCITITPAVTIPANRNFDSSDVFKKYNIVKDNYILFLGRLVPEKKPDILIKAFKKIIQQEMQLVIAGDSQNENNYKKILFSLSEQQKNIIFTGAVYGNDKEALLKNCKAFCIPSELEGLPITLLEAMSYGKICIASDIPPNLEALEESGVFFKLNNIQELTTIFKNIDNIDSRKGKLAKKKINEKFTWDKIVNQFDLYYKNILKGK